MGGRNNRCVKKQRYTILPSEATKTGMTDDSDTAPIESVDKDTATKLFDELRGDEGILDLTPSALLTNGNVIQIERAKLLACPALYGGDKLCFLGKIFVRPSVVPISPSSRGPLHFVSSEVLETESYCVVFESQVKNDAFFHHPHGALVGRVSALSASSFSGARLHK